jgi:glucokinase
MRVLAVDIGGTHVSCGAVDDQALLDVVSIEANSKGSLQDLLPVLAETLAKLAEKHGGNFAGIGCGFCGLVDTAAGRVVSTNHKYPDATSLDVAAWAREQFGLPLVLENDSRMALLGERHAGAANGSDNAVMITLGTGIGSAVIMEGTLVRGKHFQAGCLGGHFTVVLDGRRCSCGARGCFEAEASTYALAEVCKTWPGFKMSPLASEEKLDFAAVFGWAERGDSVAAAIRDRSVSIWAACALSLVHAYDPEVFVIGGGVIKSSFPIMEALQKHVDSYAWTPWGKVRFCQSKLGDAAALLGAVPLIEMHLAR